MVVDSGIGGLSLIYNCRDEGCDFIYVMDNAFCPYGEKLPEEVVGRIKSICEQQCELNTISAIILACNTATSVAIEEIRKTFSIPIIGMEPPLKSAISDGKKNIIVMSTPITNKFSKVIKRCENNSNIKLASFGDLARKIEQNYFHLSDLKQFIKSGFSDEDINKCDALVLGCSHFQYVEKQLREIFGEDIAIYHSEQGVKKRLIEILGQKIQSGNAKIAIVQTLNDANLLTIAKDILCGQSNQT